MYGYKSNFKVYTGELGGIKIRSYFLVTDLGELG